MSAAQPLFTDFAAAPREASAGIETATLLGLAQSDGRSLVEEIHALAGGAITAIGDAGQHRYIFVLDGDWSVTVGGETSAVAADATIVAPRGAACEAGVTGTAPGRLLLLTFPG